MSNLAIPVEQLKTRITETNSLYSKSILENEIKNIQVEHLLILTFSFVNNFSSIFKQLIAS